MGLVSNFFYYHLFLIFCVIKFLLFLNFLFVCWYLFRSLYSPTTCLTFLCTGMCLLFVSKYNFGYVKPFFLLPLFCSTFSYYHFYFFLTIRLRFICFTLLHFTSHLHILFLLFLLCITFSIKTQMRWTYWMEKPFILYYSYTIYSSILIGWFSFVDLFSC